jgi:AraC-like DNA-binding protein
VHFWQVTEDAKTRYHHHALPAGFGHALLSPVVAHGFATLRVGATLWDGRHWWALHSQPSISDFELEHRVDAERIDYNERTFARVLAKKKPILQKHGGYSDLFVPIVARGKVVAVLVTGPFATARATSAGLFARWRSLTGRQGHLADPEFALYVARALSTLVLEGERLTTFRRWVDLLALLLAGEGDAGALMNEAEVLHLELEKIRFPERVWEAVRTMVDERFPRIWHNAARTFAMQNLGLSRVADHVLVGLTASRKPATDAVEEAIRREAFQRASVELGRATGDVMAGQIGDHGVVFLCAATGGAARKQQKLRDLSERVSELGRKRFGLALHFGASVAAGNQPLSASFQAALGAAESALAQGVKMVTADSSSGPRTASLGRLRSELSAEVEAHPDRLPALFDRYLESVAVHCGYRADAARGYLEAGFERIAAPLLGAATLDEKSFGAMGAALERAARDANTLGELFAAYRRAVTDLLEAVQNPVRAGQDRSLRAAVAYIHQHYTERLALHTVARAAGFSPSHFSKLFIKRERMPFEKYLRALRLERAKLLLADTELDAKRIAELCGFHSAAYFSHVFREELGMTAVQYRQTRKKTRHLAWNKNDTRSS